MNQASLMVCRTLPIFSTQKGTAKNSSSSLIQGTFEPKFTTLFIVFQTPSSKIDNGPNIAINDNCLNNSFIKPIKELLRQLSLIAMLGPLSILDDGVWNTIKSVVNFGSKVPCIRELEEFLAVPFWVEKIGNVRQTIKDAWFMIQNPKVLEAKAKVFF